MKMILWVRAGSSGYFEIICRRMKYGFEHGGKQTAGHIGKGQEVDLH